MDKYDLLLAILVVFYVLICPFTKVEESFNLQATHDILEYGIAPQNLEKYDHFEFPGVVPRTFVGPLFLSFISWPLIQVYQGLNPNADKLASQYIARILLGLFTVFALSRLRTSIRISFGEMVSINFAILTVCQFHILFWSSRTLPNMFAFPLIILAFSRWILASTSSGAKSHFLSMIQLFTFAMVIFRFELFLLFGAILLFEFLKGNLRLINVFKAVATTGTICLGLSLLLDSYFWQKPFMWPEGHVFYFNAILGKSVDWGVSPFHTYFVSFLPRLLLTSFPLCMLAPSLDKRTIGFLVPLILFILGLSFLGHKEWRFIVYVVPIFNLCAAISWINIERRAFRVPFFMLKRLVVPFLVASFVACILMTYVSHLNYPGGVALNKIHTMEKDYVQARIHLDVYTAMTGASRFGQLRNDWTYFKNESHTLPSQFTNYTHLLTSNPQEHQGDFEIIGFVDAYSRLEFRGPRSLLQNWSASSQGFALIGGHDSWIWDLANKLSPIVVVTEPKVWIMKRIHA